MLVDCHTFDIGPQGTTTFLAGVLNALPAAAKSKGIAVELICAAHTRAAVERFVEVPHRYAAMRGGFVRRNALSLPRICRETGADWVISQYVRPFRSKARTASVIHDVLFLDFPHLFGWRYRALRRALFGWAASHSDAVLTVSEYSRRRIAAHFQQPAEVIDIVINAVGTRFTDGSEQPAALRQDGPVRLLMVSRLERRKRQDWCIRAAVQLSEQGVEVVLDLVGHGADSYADEVRTLARAHPDVIHLHESVDDAALVAMYKQADLFLFPSECEGFGIPVIEAAALGLPCVVAENTALSELRPVFVGPDFTGNSVDTFVEAVRAAVEDIAELRQRAQAVRGRVPAIYNWEAAAGQLLTSLAKRGGAQ
ncbi:glycosyltransferase family 4 protein [Sphingomonas sp. IC-56]|nr:glycosyltransferase family 4 protein [Sphingomonas sp. IC-56]